MDFIDLHVHTTASDGSDSPSKVVETALETGLFAIAITDHDTVAGLDEAIKAASGKPLRVIPGVEVTSTYNGRDVHILGYNIDAGNRFFLDTLAYVEGIRNERNEKMFTLLREKGFELSTEELRSKAAHSTVTRGDMGRLMLKKGYVKTIKEAFDRYLSPKAEESCYVPRFKMPLDDVYKVISYAGGICSIAHPVQYKLTDAQYRDLFDKARRTGIRCVEAIHSDNGPNDQERFSALAAESRLMITGGSDYHGIAKPEISIGTGRGNIKVPKAILRNIGISDF